MVKKVVISSDMEAARDVREELLSDVTGLGYSHACAFAIRLAVEEGLCNAIKHGNKSDPKKVVEVAMDADSERVVITITDQGQGFIPRNVPDPTLDENLEKPSGRGIMLMRAFMDQVQYNRQGNQICLLKRNAKSV